MWIVAIVLLLLLVFGLPNWGYWHGYGMGGYGYWPSGIIGVVLLVLVIWLLVGGWSHY